MPSLGLPNYITLTRLFLVPLVLSLYWMGKYGWAMLVLLIAGISDLLDGALARRFSLRTKLGAVLDPAADKILMFGCFLTLAWRGAIPLWLFAIVFARDLYIVLGVWILKLVSKKLYARPTPISKFNTFFQIAVVFLGMLVPYLQQNPIERMRVFADPVDQAFQISWVLCAIFTVMSGIHYTLIGIAIFKESKK